MARNREQPARAGVRTVRQRQSGYVYIPDLRNYSKA